MKLEFTMTPVTQALPEPNRAVLIRYFKGNRNALGNGRKGVFLTQGYLEQRMGTSIWYDYTSRQLQNVGSKGSKNQVESWAYIKYTI